MESAVGSLINNRGAEADEAGDFNVRVISVQVQVYPVLADAFIRYRLEQQPACQTGYLFDRHVAITGV